MRESGFSAFVLSTALVLVCCVVATPVPAQSVRQQPTASGTFQVPDPSQALTSVAPGWQAGGGFDAKQAHRLYQAYLAAVNRYNAVVNRGLAADPAGQQAYAEMVQARDTYFSQGLGWTRVPQGSTGSGGQSSTGTGTSNQGQTTAQQQVVDIREQVEFAAVGTMSETRDIHRTVSGDMSLLTTVLVTVTGQVTDPSGTPLSGVSIQLQRSGFVASTNAFGEYSITFTHPGFSDVDIVVDVVLQPRCLQVGPRIASLGTVPFARNDGMNIAVENACTNRDLEVEFTDNGLPFFIGVSHCSAPQGQGVAWNPGSTRMILGPGSSCQLELGLEPTTYGHFETTFVVTGSDLPSIPIPIRAMATVTDSVRIGQADVTIGGTTSVGATTPWMVTLANLDDRNPVHVTSVRVVGLHASEFDASIAVAPNLPPPAPGQAPATAVQLAPGTECGIGIDFTPSAPGTRRGFLVIQTSDPDTPEIRVPVSGIGV
jgi:hypothetical protein